MEAKKNKHVNLENKKVLFLEVGLALSLAFVILAFQWSSEPRITSLIGEVDLWTEDVQDTPVTIPTPPPPVEVLPPVISDILSITDNNDSTVFLAFSPEDRPNSPVTFNFSTITPTKKTEKEKLVEEDFDITVVTDPATIMGTDYTSFPIWVQQNVVYPQAAIDNGIEETIYLNFRIRKDGVVDNVNVLRGKSSILVEEAIRVILSSSAKWQPARQNGKPVNVVFTMPVKFQLKQ